MHWIAFYDNGKSVACFDSFGIKNIPKQFKKIGNKIIIKNIFKIQDHYSVIFCSTCLTMINIVDNFFLTGGNSTPDMCLQQHGFPFISCQLFTEKKSRIQKFKAIENI